MREIWADIRGYEGWYQISNRGRVRSTDRVLEQGSRYGHSIKRHIIGKLLVPTDNGNGYLIVALHKNNKRDNHYVHRLVAEAFLDNPQKFPVVNHLDYNKKNNSIENLEWTTQIKNTQYSIQNMCVPKDGKPSSTGEKYITRKKGRWRLNIQRKCLRVDKLYSSLEEAILAKEAIMGDEKHFAG